MTNAEASSPMGHPRRAAKGSAEHTRPLRRPLLRVVPGDARADTPPIVLRTRAPPGACRRDAQLAAVLIAGPSADAARVVLPLGTAGAWRPDCWADFAADHPQDLEISVELYVVAGVDDPSGCNNDHSTNRTWHTGNCDLNEMKNAQLLGRGYADASCFVAAMQGVWVCPIIEESGSCIAKLTCEYLVVLPFLHSGVHPSVHDLLSSTLSHAPLPSIAGHRGLGSSKTCPIQENTVMSFAAATRHLEVSHVELDVQLTKDSVPVVYHDWSYPLTSSSTLSGSPMKLHPYELTARQFTALPPSVTPPFVPALRANRSTISAKDHVGKPSLPAASKSRERTRKLFPRSESFPPTPKAGTKCNTSVPRVILNDKYPTLGAICEALAPNVGLFVEVKYPPPNVQAQDGIPYPEKNHLVDRILHCMFCETAVSNKGRSIRFLSFDADICFMLALKQIAFHVYFLHCEQRDGPNCDDADPRTISIENGIEFAVSQGFYGMALFAPMILEDETLGRRIRNERNLSLMTYGRENRTREFVKQQYERGVECVIADEVLRVAREVRHDH